MHNIQSIHRKRRGATNKFLYTKLAYVLKKGRKEEWKKAKVN